MTIYQKIILIAIGLGLLSSLCDAQDKKDSLQATSTKKISSQLGYSVISFDENASDTTACWIKIAVIDTVYRQFPPAEIWTQGYLVIFKNRPIVLNSVAAYRHPSNEFFLYANKKRINYPVISYIIK